MIGPLVGAIAEDLLGATLMAAADGSAMVGRPQLDRGIDLYLRRLRSMLTFPIQVKAILLLDDDASGTDYVPVANLPPISGGYLAVVHLPPPYDQLYERLFLIPADEFRKRCPVVTHNGIRCFQFTGQFADAVADEWAPFAIEINRLSAWIEAIPGWRRGSVTRLPASISEARQKPPNQDISRIGVLWGLSEVERVALDRLVIVDERTRLDPVTVLVHDLHTMRFAGIHLSTGILNKNRRINVVMNRRHWFTNRDLWIVVVPLEQDLNVSQDILLIPSDDMAKLGYDENVTFQPLTQRYRKYVVHARDFGKAFIDTVFGARTSMARKSRSPLAKAS